MATTSSAKTGQIFVHANNEGKYAAMVCYRQRQNGLDKRMNKGFTLELEWKPTDGKKTRPGFVRVPALVGQEPGAEFAFSFSGTGAGLFITSGHDAGRIEFSVDGGDYRGIETSTQWSTGLHLPWAVILDDQLPDAQHTIRVRIVSGALRVFYLLLNGSTTSPGVTKRVGMYETGKDKGE